MAKINLMHNSSTFTETEINARNVGDLRETLGVSKETTINVNGTRCEDDSMAIPESTDDGHAYIAIVQRDKTGGGGKIGRPRTTKATKARKTSSKVKRKTTTVKSTGTTTSYASINEMAQDAGSVMKSLVKQDGRYDNQTATAVSRLFGNQISLVKEKVNMAKINKVNANNDVLSITD